MRLDKFIADASELSRRQIQILIRQGAVDVNGTRVKNSALHINADDVVTLDGEIIHARAIRYLMLHKPAGYVCANSDSEHPTVLDLLNLPHKNTLQIVGRLDLDTTGLVLLTDDGQWNHRVTSPKSECAKTYYVETADPIAATAPQAFAAGVMLHGESKPTRAAQLELLSPTTARVTIQEGKYHQVKRMFAALGNRVVNLHRHRIGNIELDDALTVGEYRALTEPEIASVYHA